MQNCRGLRPAQSTPPFASSCHSCSEIFTPIAFSFSMILDCERRAAMSSAVRFARSLLFGSTPYPRMCSVARRREFRRSRCRGESRCGASVLRPRLPQCRRWCRDRSARARERVALFASRTTSPRARAAMPRRWSGQWRSTRVDAVMRDHRVARRGRPCGPAAPRWNLLVSLFLFEQRRAQIPLAEAGQITTIILPLFSGRAATFAAAAMFPPELMPPKMPSSLCSRRAHSKASSSVI